jgi:hypothetical protein
MQSNVEEAERANLTAEAAEMRVYIRPDGLRYDPDTIMDMPRGRAPRPADMAYPPKVEQRGGRQLAATLPFAQLPLDPRRLNAQKGSESTKLSSAERRAAKIAAGKLKVTEDGRLAGA